MPIRRASTAEAETLAMAMVSKVLRSAPRSSGDSLRATPWTAARIHRAQQHFLAAAARGQQADACLNQPHVQLGMRLPRGSVNGDFRASAEAEGEARRPPDAGRT